MWENCHDKMDLDKLMQEESNAKALAKLREKYDEGVKTRKYRSVPASIQTHDNQVIKPPHYTFSKFEVIEVLEAWFPTDPLLWQIGKYIARSKHKGKELQDLKKAKYYLDRKIKQLESTLDPLEDTPSQTKIVPGESFPL